MKLQFRLRTLMIVVTLLAVACGYVGRHIELVRERRAFCESPQFLVMRNSAGDKQRSWTDRLFGDFIYDQVIADDRVSDSDLERCRLAFPEADVRRDKDSPADGFHYRGGTIIGPKRR
jgi:hypothetical protein